MNYIITAATQEKETITTTVDYNFDDGIFVTSEIPHFMPQSVEDIEQGILNRAATEYVKINSTVIADDLIKFIPVGEKVEIETDGIVFTKK